MEYENQEIDIDDFLDEGYILVRAIIEIAGSPKDFVEDLLNDLKKKIFLFQLKEFPQIPKEKEEEYVKKIEQVFNENKDLLNGEISDRNAALVNLYISEVKEVPNSPLFSGFLEAEILVNGITNLLKFATMFTPSSIQIVEPTKIKVDNITLQEFLNETITLINNLFNNMKNLDAENKLLKEELEKCKRISLRFKK